MRTRNRRGSRSTRRWQIVGKWLVFLAVVLLVLYPRLDRLPITLQRYLDPNALIEPGAPALASLIAEFDQTREIDWDAPTLAKKIEAFTYRHVPYKHDWDLWLNVDYFPTVTETIEKGAEDCDGRAVVAASMLTHYGIDARLANDFSHVWVETDFGRALDHGNETKVVEATDDGLKIAWGAAVGQSVKAASWMVSAFPLLRELIILAAAWFLLVGTRKSRSDAIVPGLVMVIGLLLIRDGETLKVWTTWLGWLALFGSIIYLWRMPIKSR